jgi:hypothetical protein
LDKVYGEGVVLFLGKLFEVVLLQKHFFQKVLACLAKDGKSKRGSLFQAQPDIFSRKFSRKKTSGSSFGNYLFL